MIYKVINRLFRICNFRQCITSSGLMPIIWNMILTEQVFQVGAVCLSGGKRSGKFRATGSLNWRSPGVDFNDVGYLYQADMVNELVNLKYTVSKPKGIVRSYFVEFEQEHDCSYGFREYT